MFRCPRVLVNLHQYSSLGYNRWKSVVVHVKPTTEITSNLNRTGIDVQSLLGHLVKDQLHYYIGRGLFKVLAQIHGFIDEDKFCVSVSDLGQATDLERNIGLFRLYGTVPIYKTYIKIGQLFLDIILHVHNLLSSRIVQ